MVGVYIGFFSLTTPFGMMKVAMEALLPELCTESDGLLRT
jgi:hypothetical protein